MNKISNELGALSNGVTFSVKKVGCLAEITISGIDSKFYRVYRKNINSYSDELLEELKYLLDLFRGSTPIELTPGARKLKSQVELLHKLK